MRQRVGGIVLALVGVLCLPIGNKVLNRGDFSVFENLADLGVFLPMSLALLVVGLTAFGLSFLVRGEMSD